MEQFLRIGVITSPHGVKGEAKIYPTTDDARRFEDADEVVIVKEDRKIKASVTGVKYFKNMVIAKLSCFETPEEVKKFAGFDIMVSREHAVPLQEGEYYIADLIGCMVISDEGEHIGSLIDVIQTGANDVYLVKTPEDKEILFPVIDECVKEVDIENGKVVVHIMPGLID